MSSIVDWLTVHLKTYSLKFPNNVLFVDAFDKAFFAST